MPDEYSLKDVNSYPMSPLHTAALSGFSSAAEYDSHRPSYSPTAVSALLSALKIRGIQGARIIDLGAGTGKFTEILAARDEGYEILALEPHDGMREELVRKQLKGVTVGKQSAENMGVEDGWADAVICAQVGHSVLLCLKFSVSECTSARAIGVDRK